MKTSVRTRPLHVVVMCLTLGGALAPVPGRAQEQSAVRPYVLAATRLYNDLEYEQALEQISRAKRLSKSQSDDALLSLYEGVILADLGQPDSSDAAFKAALFLQPDAKLPLSVSPKVSERFESLRGRVKRELEAAAPPREPEGTRLATAEVSDAVGSGQGAAIPRRVWLSGAVGGGLLVGSGVTWMLARGQHSKLTQASGAPATMSEMKDTASRGRTYQTVSAVLAGAGVVGLGVAAGLYLWGGASRPREPGLVLGTDGTSAFVSGRWP
ncbi:hypothetical protein OWM54_37650 [Myxococcus sp. MISCRS1]|uniref:hypothetical protein n=1 Tax=Myxococcus TaxID=32 RepID=UPI00226FDF60|nr:hypothetical protein [Myxococcus sp. MISCRS1]MCY1002888.1 hypothetical protein [Myxococcus sp. MISCRS1]BDT35524.1 hypothetical protein MFMH1_51930 [Myxococcus sp. MH1]